MKHLLAIVLLVTSVASNAQQLRPATSSEIYGNLLGLRSMVSVLYVAAHPDDENTRLLSWLARGQHIRTAYLSVTRGDGGQNILGSVQGAGLGLVRTHELLAARDLDGAGQYFTRAIDFGYSKHAQETFNHWDADQLTRDVIHVINEFRPDVVICRFPASRMAGHGQHEASAMLAERAYAECEPNIRPKRLLFNAYNFGDRSTIQDGMFSLTVGQYDPLIGMGYGELAGRSRSLHKSQGAGTRSTPGVQDEFFATLAGEPPTKSLFDGIDTTWSRVGRADIGVAIDKLIEGYKPTAPHESLSALLRIRAMIAEVGDEHWQRIKLAEVNDIIASVMGITADAATSKPIATPGEELNVELRIVTRAGVPVQLTNISWLGEHHAVNQTLEHDVLFTTEKTVAIPTNALPTNPYWLQKPGSDGQFAIEPEEYLGLPTTPPQHVVTVTLNVNNETVVVSLPLSYKTTDPIDGDVVEELRIVPIVSVEPIAPLVVRTPSGLTASVRLRAFNNCTGNVVVSTSQGNRVVATNVELRANTDTLITFTPDVSTTQTIRVAFVIEGKHYNKAVQIIDYSHLPTLQYLEPAEIRVVPEDITIAAKRVAFVAGAGEITPDVLRMMGVSVDELADNELVDVNKLLEYDAVLLGVRALNTRDALKYQMPSLMSYVQRGGTVVVQYNTSHRLVTTEIGPYPLKLSRDRVTEEDAAVKILKPNHELFTNPNTIDTDDFLGWVQERGLYFTADRASEYEVLLEMNDTGEEPLTGSLLFATHGKGRYIYCSLSLFRQLPAGVPGAMKLLANMLSKKR